VLFICITSMFLSIMALGLTIKLRNDQIRAQQQQVMQAIQAQRAQQLQAIQAQQRLPAHVPK
jgi:hypothetical protein